MLAAISTGNPAIQDRPTTCTLRIPLIEHPRNAVRAAVMCQKNLDQPPRLNHLDPLLAVIESVFPHHPVHVQTPSPEGRV